MTKKAMKPQTGAIALKIIRLWVTLPEKDQKKLLKLLGGSMKSILIVLLLSTTASADYVSGYQRRDGSYVQGYQRTHQDSTVYNNYNQPSPNYNAINQPSTRAYEQLHKEVYGY